jgi:hypothetical protein
MTYQNEQKQRSSMIGSTVGIGVGVGIGIGTSRILERELGPILGFLGAMAIAAVVAIGLGYAVSWIFGETGERE